MIRRLGRFFRQKTSTQKFQPAKPSTPLVLASLNVSTSTEQQQQTQQQRSVHTSATKKNTSQPRALDMNHFYTEFPLNRSAELRTDKSHLESLYAAPTTLLIPHANGKFLVQRKAEGPYKVSIPFMLRNPAGLGDELLAPGAIKVFLGIDSESGSAVFSAEVADSKAAWIPGEDCEWVNARSEGPMMTPKDAALIATASGLASWHAKNKYCGRCGGRLGPKLGGHGLECIGDAEKEKPSCRNSVFPRNDPATITLVTCGDWLLLGRKAEWTAGRYSLLAGFVELGESLEQGVAREIQEESGVKIDLSTVAYHSSQPWPFPQSLMIGMEAEAVWEDPRAGVNMEADPLAFIGNPTSSLRRAIEVQGITASEVESYLIPGDKLPVPAPEEDELEDVRWFHRDFLKATLIDGRRVPGAENLSKSGGSFNIPGEYSLAGKAIKEWIMREPSKYTSWAGDDFPDVQLDAGVFKYVLMRLTDAQGRSKLLCHGSNFASFHDNVYQSVRVPAAKAGLKCEVLGGGRIEHHPGAVANVYGYSMAFGPAPHEISAELIRRWYPFYDPRSVMTSYEGY